ncbi:MAG: hypothetical protein IT379_11910 [Deltaproteobacteria bacterium]|nr:hypothetical protein [Deltaproteobacteria bacterium]
MAPDDYLLLVARAHLLAPEHSDEEELLRLALEIAAARLDRSLDDVQEEAQRANLRRFG